MSTYRSSSVVHVKSENIRGNRSSAMEVSVFIGVCVHTGKTAGMGWKLRREFLCESSHQSTDSLKGWQNTDGKQEVQELEDETNSPMHSFWSSQPDPVLIERGQTEAIRLVRNTVNSTTIAATGEPMEANTMDMSRVPCMVFVDDEGLEEQFLKEDEGGQEVMDITTNQVMTPIEKDTVSLNPIYTQRSQRDEGLDLQPSRGPREESLANTLNQFLDDNYEDVLRTSNIETNFSISASNRDLTGQPMLPLGWIVPDGTNQTLGEISDKKISSGVSPDGGQAGAIVTSLQRLEPYYRTQFFLVDLETGEVFAYTQQWRRAGLYCSNQPFPVNELMLKVECHGQAIQAEIEAEQQTPLIDIRRTPSQFEVPPPLLAMDEPDIYILHPDAMQTNTRKNYVRDWM